MFLIWVFLGSIAVACQTTHDDLAESVQDISPDAKTLVGFIHLQLSPQLVLQDLSSRRMVAVSFVDSENVLRARFLDGDELFVVTDGGSSYIVNIESGMKREITALAGFVPSAISVDRHRNIVAFAVDRFGDAPPNLVSKIILYDWKGDSAKLYEIEDDFQFVFDMQFFREDTLLLNKEGSLQIWRIGSQRLDPFPMSAKSAHLGDGRINLNRSLTKLFFSNEKGGLAYLNLRSGVSKPLPICRECLYPILSPDETFFIAAKVESGSLKSHMITDMSFLDD